MKMGYLDDNLQRYFGRYINGKDTASKEYFKAAVDIALNEYNLPVSDIAKEFQVADSTIKRWASGVAVPHPLLRQRVLEWIVENI